MGWQLVFKSENSKIAGIGEIGKVRVFSQLPKPTATEFSLQNIPLLGLPEVPWWFVSVNKVLSLTDG